MFNAGVEVDRKQCVRIAWAGLDRWSDEVRRIGKRIEVGAAVLLDGCKTGGRVNGKKIWIEGFAGRLRPVSSAHAMAISKGRVKASRRPWPAWGRRDDKKAAKRWETNNPMAVRGVGRILTF